MAKIKDFRASSGTIVFCCPGCMEQHTCRVADYTDPAGKVWPKVHDFNGSLDHPTIRASVLKQGGASGFRCHGWVTDGAIQFCDDCDHQLKGQTVDLPDIGNPHDGIIPARFLGIIPDPPEAPAQPETEPDAGS